MTHFSPKGRIMPPRFLLLIAFAAALLLIPATAEGHSGLRVRGTVALKDEASGLVTVRTQRAAVALRVPGSLSLIRIGQRVELRGSTLRARGHGSRVLARNVVVAGRQPLTQGSTPATRDDDDDDDELEVKGTLTSLSPTVQVVSGTRTVSCVAPAGFSLRGFATGDFVEMKCDLVAGTFVLRKLEHEDDDDNSNPGPGADDDDDDDSGPGGGDDDDDDSGGRGSGGGGDDD